MTFRKITGMREVLAIPIYGHLLIYKCTPIQHFNILPSNTSTTCYDKPRIEAFYEGKRIQGFLDTVHNIIVGTAIPRPCTTAVNYYQLDNALHVIKTTGTTANVTEPEVIVDENYDMEDLKIRFNRTKYTPFADIQLDEITPGWTINDFLQAFITQRKMIHQLFTRKDKGTGTGRFPVLVSMDSAIKSFWTNSFWELLNGRGSLYQGFIFYGACIVWIVTAIFIISSIVRCFSQTCPRAKKTVNAIMQRTTTESDNSLELTETAHCEVQGQPTLATRLYPSIPTTPTAPRIQPPNYQAEQHEPKWPENYVCTLHAEIGKAMAQVIVNNLPCRALLDSGSSITVISQQLCNKLRLAVRPAAIAVAGAGGHSLNILGKADIDLKIANKQLTVPTYIIDRLPNQDVIVGIDTFKQLQLPLTFDFNKQTFRIDTVEQPLINQIRVLPKVTLQQDVIIQPESACWVRAKTTSAADEAMIFDPHRRVTAKHQIMMPTALVLVAKDKQLPVQIFNPNTETVHLRQGMCIGHLNTQASVMLIEQATPRLTEEEFQKKINLDDSPITEQQKRKVRQLLWKYNDAFCHHDYDIGRAKDIKQEIKLLPHTEPIQCKPYPIAKHLQQHFDEIIDKMLKHGIISKAISAYSSPCLLVQKKETNERRLVCDFRLLNKYIPTDQQSLPKISELLAKLNTAKLFTVFDLRHGFWQIEIEKESRQYTAFKTYNGQVYEYNRSPMGLSNSPATMSRLTAYMLAGCTNLLHYVDDILAYGEDFERLYEATEKALALIQRQGLKLQPTKCKFFRDNVRYLGHQVTAKGISPDPDNVEKVKKFPTPTSITKVQSFLGLAQYFRKFLPNFAKTAKPLYDLLKFDKWKQDNWTQRQQESFDEIKRQLTSDALLQHPDFDKPFIIETDASGTGLGAVLLQETEDKKERPIAYVSRALKPNETKWSATERELLGVLFALRQFHYYIYGSPIQTIVRTDHAPLTYVVTTKGQTNNRLIRMTLKIQDYNYKLVYKPGITNKAADALSRAYEVNAIHPIPNIKELVDETERDNFYQAVKDDDKNIKLSPMERKFLRKQRQHLTINKSRLYWMSDNKPKIYIPYSFRQAILNELHDNPLAGHLSAAKTIARVEQYYFWPTMYGDIKQYCNNCHSCAASKTGRRQKPQLQSIPKSTTMDCLSIDITGPLPPSCLQGIAYTYILTALDIFSKFAIAIPIPDITAQTVAMSFFNEIICKYGTPKNLTSDNGSQFTSQLFQQVVRILNITQIYTSTYNPKANMVERFHRNLHEMITHFAHQQPEDWIIYLQSVTMAYNSAIHRSTDNTPFFLMFGRDFQPPNLLAQQLLPSQYVEVPTSIQKFVTQLHLAWKVAKHNIDNQVALTTGTDTRSTTLTAGDIVYLHYPPQQTHKHAQKYKGPYRVVQLTSPTTARLANVQDPHQHQFYVHIHRLKKINTDTATFLPTLDNADRTRSTNRHIATKHEETQTTDVSQPHGYNLRPR
uniref:Retrovirus-related polyprotein n=1 Tax=Macrostomum lignano TaxID=282301 RepID=A0A0M4HFM6_9PLAT|nr:retrovirus-related polyprotein [Macrostomum lignano]